MLMPAYNSSGSLCKSLIKRLCNKKIAIFLDYDGTLTPIVKRPEQAKLAECMRKLLKELAKCYPVIIISGRSLRDLKDKIKIRKIYYAGNHGLELGGPALSRSYGLKYCKKINQLSRRLSFLLKKIPNILVENKKFSLSVHYRMVNPTLFPLIDSAINAELEKYSDLKRRSGKKVIEIYPDIGWGKGSALNWYLKFFHLAGHNTVPIYLGDDFTDEDAFLELQKNGIGILVSELKRKSYASYVLKDTREVYQFLNDILRMI